MIEDKLLILRFKHGSRRALARIYEKYEGYLLTLATALLNDVNSAEDIVHDFFVSFAQSADSLKLEGSLKGYLATCVANRTRDSIRIKKRQPDALDESIQIRSNAKGPELAAICNEELQLLNSALSRLPYEQREVLILHLRGDMKFIQIAKSQNVSINTVQSRYRYGLDKLRTLLDGEVLC
ncbi:MAG TPA: sigma-70 family RNA polymerase sigma factor [Planctomycetes bacterium]|nr:sigma-70 family RNA polymerase sigma factor [Planctomycetota bacterium]HIJ69808.1 sigma-70 family RNA polymerase sigma factor [Planctomycetota bacterium]